MLLTSFCKPQAVSAYDRLQGEVDYFTAVSASKEGPVVAVSAQKLTYNNMPQTVSALVARLHADIARVDAMTDAFGKEITLKNIAKLSAFLTSNNVSF